MIIIKGLHSKDNINKVLDKLKKEGIDLLVLSADITKGTLEFVATKNVSKLQILTIISNGQLWSKLTNELEGIEKIDNLFKARDAIINGELSGINHEDNLGVFLNAEHSFAGIENKEEAEVIVQSIISMIMVVTLHINRN